MSEYFHSAHRFVLFSVVYYIFSFELGGGWGVPATKVAIFGRLFFIAVVAVCWFVGCCLFLLLFRLFGFGLVVVVLGWMG